MIFLLSNEMSTSKLDIDFVFIGLRRKFNHFVILNIWRYVIVKGTVLHHALVLSNTLIGRGERWLRLASGRLAETCFAVSAWIQCSLHGSNIVVDSGTGKIRILSSFQQQLSNVLRNEDKNTNQSNQQACNQTQSFGSDQNLQFTIVPGVVVGTSTTWIGLVGCNFVIATSTVQAEIQRPSVIFVSDGTNVRVANADNATHQVLFVHWQFAVYALPRDWAIADTTLMAGATVDTKGGVATVGCRLVLARNTSKEVGSTGCGIALAFVANSNCLAILVGSSRRSAEAALFIHL